MLFRQCYWQLVESTKPFVIMPLIQNLSRLHDKKDHCSCKNLLYLQYQLFTRQLIIILRDRSLFIPQGGTEEKYGG